MVLCIAPVDGKRGDGFVSIFFFLLGLSVVFLYFFLGSVFLVAGGDDGRGAGYKKYKKESQFVCFFLLFFYPSSSFTSSLQALFSFHPFFIHSLIILLFFLGLSFPLLSFDFSLLFLLPLSGVYVFPSVISFLLVFDRHFSSPTSFFLFIFHFNHCLLPLVNSPLFCFSLSFLLSLLSLFLSLSCVSFSFPSFAFFFTFSFFLSSGCHSSIFLLYSVASVTAIISCISFGFHFSFTILFR